MIVDESFEQLAIELKQARADMAKLKKTEDQIRSAMLRRLGDETRALTASGGPVAHVEIQSRTTVNRNKLQALYPDVYDACTGETEVHVLRIDL